MKSHFGWNSSDKHIAKLRYSLSLQPNVCISAGQIVLLLVLDLLHACTLYSCSHTESTLLMVWKTSACLHNANRVLCTGTQSLVSIYLDWFSSLQSSLNFIAAFEAQLIASRMPFNKCFIWYQHPPTLSSMTDLYRYQLHLQKVDASWQTTKVLCFATSNLGRHMAWPGLVKHKALWVRYTGRV